MSCKRSWRTATTCILFLISLVTISYFHYTLDLASTFMGKRVAKSRLASPVAAVSESRSNSELSEQQEKKVKSGYVLALSYVDPLTESVANLLSMQCWAYTLGEKMQVLEPFLLQSSTLGFDFLSMVLKLTDVFDEGEWHRYTTGLFAPLVDWSHFMKEAPRKIILVSHKCTGEFECTMTDKFLKTAKTLGFKVAQTVSYPVGDVSQEKFRNLIYSKHAPHEVVVIFDFWGGVQPSVDESSLLRIGIIGKDVQKCRRRLFMVNMPVSNRIRNNAKRYAEAYLTSADNKHYISVMVQMERFAAAHGHESSANNTESLITTCFEKLNSSLNFLKKKYNTSSVLLALDQRKKETGYLTFDKIESLYKMVYGKLRPKALIEAAAASSSAGYIALLQKHLAVRGICLLLVGTASVQQTMAQKQYYSYHLQQQTDGDFKCGAFELPSCA